MKVTSKIATVLILSVLDLYILVNGTDRFSSEIVTWGGNVMRYHSRLRWRVPVSVAAEVDALWSRSGVMVTAHEVSPAACPHKRQFYAPGRTPVQIVKSWKVHFTTSHTNYAREPRYAAPDKYASPIPRRTQNAARLIARRNYSKTTNGVTAYFTTLLQ